MNNTIHTISVLYENKHLACTLRAAEPFSARADAACGLGADALRYAALRTLRRSAAIRSVLIPMSYAQRLRKGRHPREQVVTVKTLGAWAGCPACTLWLRCGVSAQGVCVYGAQLTAAALPAPRGALLDLTAPQ